MGTSKYEVAQTINFRIYSLFGYWRTGSKNRYTILLYDLYSAVVLLSTTVYTILQVIDLKDSWSNIDDLSTNLSATVTSIFSLSKVYNLRLRMNQVESLRQKLREFLHIPGVGVSDEDKEILERDAVNFLKTCKTMTAIVWPTIFTWWVVSGLDRTLPVRQWFPFEFERFGYAYYGVYVYQCVLLAYFAAIVIYMDLIFCSFVFLVCSHFDILEKNIRKFGARPKGASHFEENRKIINDIVIHHQEALRTAKEVDDLFYITNLIHFIGVGVLISVTEYDLIQKTAALNTQFLRQMGNLAATFFDLFIYSYYGTLLEEKSKAIGFAVYDTNWFGLTTSEKKTLMFIMVRSGKHSRLTAGKMFALNFEIYLGVVRISYNLLALLRQTK